MHLLEIRPSALDLESVAKRLRVLDQPDVMRLVHLIRETIRPRVAYRVCYVEERGEESVMIDGVRFSSRVLHDNLKSVGRVFPFVMTLGAAADALMDGTTSTMDKYFLGETANHALRETRRVFERQLCDKFALEKISCMTPGSLGDWPIEYQERLFALLPEVEASIGVRLTENLLMLPRRSVAGLYFPSKATFVSCQLCPRRLCDDRKAPYNDKKARRLKIDMPQRS